MRRRSARLVAAAIGATLALALLLSPAAIAGKAPSLASTAQYKAFVDYVKKLDGLVGQATTAAQKATYETELTAKMEAAAHKANALFKRVSEEARADFDAKFKEQAAAIRRGEEADLEDLKGEFDVKRERAEAGYRAKVENVNSGSRKFERRLNEQIAALRAEKAQAPAKAEKDAIQQRISKLIDEIEAKRSEASEKRADLKAGFGKQKEELNAAEAKQAGKIESAAEEKIKQSSKHWKRVFNDKKASFNAKRESQLSYLRAKLEKGRADIATMPAVG